MKLTKIYTYWSTLGGCLGEPMLFVSNRDGFDTGAIGVQEHEVNIEVNEPTKADSVQAIVKELRAKQDEHRANISKIEDRISSLLCLEHKEVA